MVDPYRPGILPRRPALEQPAPPHGRIQRPRPPVERRVHVGEEVPHVADEHAHDLVLGHGAVQHQAEAHEHPGEVGRREDEQAEEAEAGVRVAARPDVDQRRGEGVAEEGHRDERGEEDEAGHGVEEEPGEVRRGAARGLLEEAGVALEEVDVEEEVEGEGAEVEEGC